MDNFLRIKDLNGSRNGGVGGLTHGLSPFVLATTPPLRTNNLYTPMLYLLMVISHGKGKIEDNNRFVFEQELEGRKEEIDKEILSKYHKICE